MFEVHLHNFSKGTIIAYVFKAPTSRSNKYCPIIIYQNKNYSLAKKKKLYQTQLLDVYDLKQVVFKLYPSVVKSLIIVYLLSTTPLNYHHIGVSFD